MDDEKIKTFLTLADNLSFTKTAFLLHKSQSVVSRQILSMEAEVGFPLFVRDSRYCSLTASGKKLAEGLARLEKDYLKVVSEARLLQEGKSGTLVIGMHGGETTTHYSEFFRDFQRTYPYISVTFVDYRVAELNKRMQEGEIDIAHIVTMGQWFVSSKSLYTDGRPRSTSRCTILALHRRRGHCCQSGEPLPVCAGGGARGLPSLP